jgi:hypothetical protein
VKEFAGLDRQRNVVDGLEFAKTAADIADLEQGHGLRSLAQKILISKTLVLPVQSPVTLLTAAGCWACLPVRLT